MEIAPAHHSVRRPAGARLLAAVRTESGLFLLGTGVVALHVLDDNFLQPNPGTSASDHLVSGLVPLALLVAAAVALRPAPRRRPRRRSRSCSASSACSPARRPSTTRERSVRRATTTRVCCRYSAGLLLLGVGIVTLWRRGARTIGCWWRYGRRSPVRRRDGGHRGGGPGPLRDWLRRHACLARARCRRPNSGPPTRTSSSRRATA